MLLVHLLMLGMWMKKELQVNCQMLIKLEKSIDMEEFPDDRFVRGQLLAEFLHNRHLSLQEGGREAAVEAEEPQDQGQAEEDDERRIRISRLGYQDARTQTFFLPECYSRSCRILTIVFWPESFLATLQNVLECRRIFLYISTWLSIIWGRFKCTSCGAQLEHWD